MANLAIIPAMYLEGYGNLGDCRFHAQILLSKLGFPTNISRASIDDEYWRLPTDNSQISVNWKGRQKSVYQRVKIALPFGSEKACKKAIKTLSELIDQQNGIYARSKRAIGFKTYLGDVPTGEGWTIDARVYSPSGIGTRQEASMLLSRCRRAYIKPYEKLCQQSEKPILKERKVSREAGKLREKHYPALEKAFDGSRLPIRHVAKVAKTIEQVNDMEKELQQLEALILRLQA